MNRIFSASISRLLPPRFLSLRRTYSITEFGGTKEGIRLNNPLITKRTQTIQKLEDELYDNASILIKAPPFFGKSSLANLYAQHCKEKNRHVINITMIGLPLFEKNYNNSYGDSVFDAYWEKETGTSWREVLSNPNNNGNIDIIIDEGQEIYERSPPFWTAIKAVSATIDPQWMRILMFASYGDYTAVTCRPDGKIIPLSFEKILSAKDIALTRNELNEMVANYNALGNMLITETVSEAIWNLTAGHVGLIKTTLDRIRDMFKMSDPKLGLDDSDILMYLLSKEYRAIISRTRAVPDTTNPDLNLRINLSPIETEILMSIINSKDRKIPYLEQPSYETAVRGLVNAGFLVTSSDWKRETEFVAPVVQDIFTHRLLGCR